ncbi:hypothetical protein OSH64_24240 [Mycobacterium ulcerans]
MFTVVEHQQCPTVSQSFDHHLQQRPGGLIANAQRRGRRRNQQLTIAQVAQLDQPHAIAKFPDTFVGGPHRQGRLTDSTDPGQRHQSRIQDQLFEFGKFGGTVAVRV